MDNRDSQDLPTVELPELRKTEAINGQAFPVGTAEQFAHDVFKRPLRELLALKQLRLVIRKFLTAAGKQYRLVWQGRGRGWLAAEDQKPYATRARAVAAGVELAASLGADFEG